MATSPWPRTGRVVARLAPARLACRPLTRVAATHQHARCGILTVPQSSRRWALHNSFGFGATDEAASRLWQPRRGAKRRSKKGRKEAPQAVEQEDGDEDQDDDEVPEFDVMEAELKINTALEYLAGRYASLQTGRAAPALIEGVIVNAYEGAPAMPLPQLANITVRDPQTLAVQLYDPSIGNAVVKSIQSAGLDLNPSLENKSVIVPVPKMTAEGRQSVIKTAGTLGEQTKQSIRVTRQEAMKKLKHYAQAVSMSKDEAKKLEDELQAVINAATKTVGDMVDEKTQELSR